MSLNRLFDARSIAIVGASDDPERIGGRPLAYLRNSWLTRDDRAVYPVNPTRPEVQGLRSHASVSAIGASIDLAIIAVPAARIEDAIIDCGRSGCKAAIIFSSGFGELGEAGRLRQQRMHKTATQAGMRLLGPNCLGVIDVRQGMYATFSEAARDQNHAPGVISVASQSGAVAVQLLMLGRRLGIGMNKLISTGNEEDIDVAESVAYLAADPTTRVIIAYLEGCRDGNRLVAALQLAQAAGKPVIVVKVGRSASGSQATLSHTGSLAGEDRIYDAVFRQYGAYRADSFDEAMDVATMFASAGPAQGKRIGLLSISGGVGAMMADTAEACGLDVAPIRPSAAADSLRELASFSTLQNPLDITAQAINDMSLWRKNLEVMLGGPWLRRARRIPDLRRRVAEIVRSGGGEHGEGARRLSRYTHHLLQPVHAGGARQGYRDGLRRIRGCGSGGPGCCRLDQTRHGEEERGRCVDSFRGAADRGCGGGE